MRYIIILIVFTLLFVQCRTKVELYPTGSYDTLGVQWMTMERNNIIYYFQGTGERAASLFTDLHEEAYEDLAQVFNPGLPGKLRLFVWTDWVEAQQKLGIPLGFAYPPDCICHIKFNQTLGHEITHILSYWANGTAAHTYSRLVTEGVAVAFDLSGRNKMDNAKEALIGTDIRSITDIWSGDYQNAPEDVFYPIAGAFMEYLYKKNMQDEFFALLKNQKQIEAEQIYGKDVLDSIIRDFDAQLGL